MYDVNKIANKVRKKSNDFQSLTLSKGRRCCDIIWLFYVARQLVSDGLDTILMGSII